MTTIETKSTAQCARLMLTLRGVVQGVGFRPFVHRLATELALAGRINNSPQGVVIEVEGSAAVLEQFFRRLTTETPPRSCIQNCEAAWLDAVGFRDFQIGKSETSGNKTALVPPDIATCPDCLREILDPANRRYRYPFTNCTNCGPRFSLIEALPYDRANTSMKSFTMCSLCQGEYDNPRDRRFHAQPNACPACGPQLELWCGNARERSDGGDVTKSPRSNVRGSAALLAAADAIRRGQIVAVKGIGGFHLLVDARNEAAVRRLRERKHREEKPFALMFPTLASVKAVCEVSPLEERLIQSPEAPIVLLQRRSDGVLEQWSDGGRNEVHPISPSLQHSVSPSVAPNNPNFGVMLPSNPLHHLLMAELGFPIVATSGNLSDEPICTDEFDAFERLRGIADVFLVHNRPIVRQVDDSIARVILGREMILRRARGYAPLPVSLNHQPSTNNHQSILAVGAHLKNTVALAVGEQVFLSQHIGDLETEQANNAFRRGAADLPRFYNAQPEIITADLHPDYLSTQFAEEMGSAPVPGAADRVHAVGKEAKVQCEGALNGSWGGCAPRIIRVQHHVAHVLSCIAENEVPLPALGVAWDGTGYGTDGTIWGGEFFLVTEVDVERVAHLRPFRLPGGDAAVKEPRRSALGLLFELANNSNNLLLHLKQKVVGAFSPAERVALETMLARGVNSPQCTSIGRLFDGVAALVELRAQTRFEGQAAMELEFALDGIETDEHYDMPLVTGHSALLLDWSPMIEGVLTDVQGGVSIGEISAKFHNALAEAIVRVAQRVECPRVALSGGCFQNRYLTERAVTRLRVEGFQPYWHRQVPPNDGGIALGQIAAARRAISNRKS